MSSELSPKTSGFYMPAEWAQHESVWLAWPSAADLWEEELPFVQKEFIALCEAIRDIDASSQQAQGEALHIIVTNKNAELEAKKHLQHLSPTFHLIPFGDIWCRDTLPVFLQGPNQQMAALKFRFNGWGGKYTLAGDSELSANVAKATGLKTFSTPWIFEGGALEIDGEGTILTSRQCLLNPNRNPSLSETQIEAILCDLLGAKKVIWVTDGLLNDHTDGHIDTIARFIAPGKVMIMQASGEDDPNADILAKIEQELKGQVDAKGRTLEIIKVPSPGKVLDYEGEIMPASYVNFYISNTAVIVPTYGSAYDTAALQAMTPHFTGRKIIGLSAKSILEGGGAFHCITQQQPTQGEK